MSRQKDLGTLATAQYHPFAWLYDKLIDGAIENAERRKALTEEEREAEDRATAERKELEEQAWQAEHQTSVNIRVETREEAHITWHFSPAQNRQRLRKNGYHVDVPEGAQAFFEARDHQWYPLADYPEYDRTGNLPPSPPAPNPIADYVWSGFPERVAERWGEIAVASHVPSEPKPTLSRKEEIEQEVQSLLATWEAEEQRRAALTPEEREAEDREWEVEKQRMVEEHEERRRTSINVRRADEAKEHTLSRAEIRARGFQQLFAMRRDDEDVYFEAHDCKWYRIEAYPEYDRSSALPSDHFLAPADVNEPSVIVEALHRARAIWQERKRRSRPD